MSEKVIPPRQQFQRQGFYNQLPIANQQYPQTQQSWSRHSQQSGATTGFLQHPYPQQSQWQRPSVPHYANVQRAGQFIQKNVHTPPPLFEQKETKRAKRDFFKKKVHLPIWGIILAIILSIAVLVTSVYATGSRAIPANLSIPLPGSSNRPVGETDAAPTTVATFVPTVIPTSVGIAKVGSTITTAGGLACTLISVQAIQGDAVTYPKPGDTFIIVHIRMTNNSSSDYDYFSVNFQVISGTGNGSGSIDAAPSTYTARNQILMGTLIPGGTVQGDLVFEVAIGDHKAELSWQPDATGSVTENVWNLGL